MEEIRGEAPNADIIRFAIQGNRPIGAKELSAMKSIYEVARRLGAAIGGKSRPIQILIVDVFRTTCSLQNWRTGEDNEPEKPNDG